MRLEYSSRTGSIPWLTLCITRSSAAMLLIVLNLMCPSLLGGSISTTCAIKVLRSSNKCKYIFMLPQKWNFKKKLKKKKNACNGLLHRSGAPDSVFHTNIAPTIPQTGWDFFIEWMDERWNTVTKACNPCWSLNRLTNNFVHTIQNPCKFHVFPSK